MASPKTIEEIKIPENQKAPELPKTRAEKRRLRRLVMKHINPPKYGPVIIFTEKHERVEGGKNVKFKKGYTAVTNIKELKA